MSATPRTRPCRRAPDQIDLALKASTESTKGEGDGDGFWGGLWNGTKQFVAGAVGGDFAGDQGWSGLVGQGLVGFIPFVGQVADARDTISAIEDVVTGEPGGWPNLGWAAVAWVPGVGDVVKVVVRGVRRADGAADEVADGAKKNQDGDAPKDGDKGDAENGDPDTAGGDKGGDDPPKDGDGTATPDYPGPTPRGAANAVVDPSVIRGGRIAADDLSAMIPAGTPNTWVPDASPGGYNGPGFKYQWVGEDGTRYTVWGHGPNPNAPEGSNAALGDTVRIRVNNKHLTTEGKAVNNVTGNSEVGQKNANDSHIPYDP